MTSPPFLNGFHKTRNQQTAPSDLSIELRAREHASDSLSELGDSAVKSQSLASPCPSEEELTAETQRSLSLRKVLMLLCASCDFLWLASDRRMKP
jgi:hypothetical protein